MGIGQSAALARKAVKTTAKHSARGTASKLKRDPVRAVTLLGVGGLVFRTVQLFFIRDVETGLVWAAKILTDPFNDFRLYRRAPAELARRADVVLDGPPAVLDLLRALQRRPVG